MRSPAASSVRHPASSLALALVAVILMLAVGDPPAAHAKDTVRIKGTAYAFDDQTPIAGATIRARGAPGVSATSREDGRYALEVPVRTKVTPYAEEDGYHGIFLQTFKTHSRDLRRVNFQIPTEGTYFALAALLRVELDANGDPARCAIVSTASTKKVRKLSFAEFVAFGAHGVAGATAATRPALPDPIYFNDSVIPDRSLVETTVDGGIIWTEVPSGKYKVTATHPDARFASFRATCRDGRVVNANPPWGLHQLRDG